ncbi:hypothetical protein QBC37DRAFT_463011 [Rhypophila decipiens]|uniref:NACHT domain-containing protein n=1 Tax=Rhypophila decipiens TaxID=261697 RepID=A0AAN6Y774_9PEZI|nr:hypothetical protein QBC37DRAFT_463011 [Rhypophila decipiens]
MEPLVALSLAGSIVQFVQFATQLFNGARALHSSPGGSSVESSRLEDVYTRLAALSHSMGTTPTRHRDSNNGRHTSEEDDMTRQLKVLAANYQEDCNKLLAIVQKLNVKTRSGPGWWNSFHVAFLEHERSGDLKVLRQRINKHQNTVTLLLCATSKSQEVRGIRQALDDLGKAVEDIRPADITTGDGRKIGGSISSIKNLYTQTERMKAEQNILSSLDYNKRHFRHEAIPKAHQQTFGWVFTSQDDAHLGGGNLLKWLRKGSGIFWVSGKPGSGKSTFLKFVAEDPRTLTALKEWGDGKSVGLASHYFWAAGSSIQKSQEGLLRSILYEILEQAPSLIPKVIPGRWASAIHPSPFYLDTKDSVRLWTLEDLELAINNVEGQLDVVDLPEKFCIFVDGLDEYTGDHAKLCQTLERLAKARCAKMCVSSRPWNVFEEHVGLVASGRIDMHELTQGDIYSYAESQLASHSTWAVLGRVFLWVVLVTKELREGMNNYDTLSDLWRRLDSIPEDLEQFFQAVLGSVEPFYHNKMAGTLQIALSAKEPLKVEVYCFHDLEYEDGRYALSDQGGAWDEKTWEEFKRPFPRRLNSRCKGLLEIHQGRVEFLHRTVSDFLRTDELSNYVASRTRNGFNATLSIVQAYAAWLSHLDPSNKPVIYLSAKLVAKRILLGKLRLLSPEAIVND